MILADRLRAGETAYMAWCGFTDPLFVEAVARGGFDAVTLDMQHGYHTEASIPTAIGAVALAGKPAVVRVPLGRFDMASRALDFGAEAVIAPMINSVEDAHAFGAAMKFPPLGERSWGPGRAMALRGQDSRTYLANANATTLALAMIETRQALASLDAILSVPLIDGIFVGPYDFSVAWSGGDTVDPTLPDMMDAIGSVAKKAAEAGKIAGAFAPTPDFALRLAGMGFRLISVATDGHYLSAGIEAHLKPLRKL